ncbi:hypothetical protein J2W28_001051 [Variovorax boronicumulans]|uniref:hypothetical protein n=1 Tax=Variovorax boronicumulans TaxID=436515 RepID=UPI00278142DB|nr:hypothetical protein [Variovorax boronicumulans]MDP9992023.1 hypothetical protein [Variovorax boronicumulans]MDQ0001918.1 hypothetical protein [Variovorax boronicumulans]
MPKPTRTAKQLHQLLIERIEAIPDLAGQITDVHRGYVVGTGVYGDDGPSWTVPVLTDRNAHRPDIARIIRQLQMQFDLED